MNKNKKIALITGAGNGIGAETAIELSKNNMHVIISDKSLSSLNNTENTIIENGGTCTVVELDMRDFLGIDRLGIEIFKRWKKLDVLISNAAILGTLGPIYHQSNDEFLDVVNVNLISNHRLIRSFDSLLKNSVSPKAFFLTSSVAKKAKPFWGAYAVSKASLEHMVRIWSEENKQTNLSISIIDPGKTNTKMRKQAMPGEDKSHLQNPNQVAKFIVKKIISNEIFKGNIIEIYGLNN
ncbi:SDR family NAD(P)-dependent oxidoreductase [Alphaproteobacteria bacterium]|nr:SDR family NAD(P)-dependent oxidoreductase [Alphaproteobacteria bacterium]